MFLLSNGTYVHTSISHESNQIPKTEVNGVVNIGLKTTSLYVIINPNIYKEQTYQ